MKGVYHSFQFHCLLDLSTVRISLCFGKFYCLTSMASPRQHKLNTPQTCHMTSGKRHESLNLLPSLIVFRPTWSALYINHYFVFVFLRFKYRNKASSHLFNGFSIFSPESPTKASHCGRPVVSNWLWNKETQWHMQQELSIMRMS